MSETDKNTNQCHGCHSGFGIFTNYGSICPVEHGGCGYKFCSTCLNYSCITEAGGNELGMKAPIISYCKECFKKNCGLDYSSNYTTYGPEVGTAPAVLFIHGGSGCRSMFDYHAKFLSEKRGYRCVLMDLPGHGSRMDDLLTLETALIGINDGAKIAGSFGDIRPIAVGGSLGGYLLMEYVGTYPDVFSGAVITMAGQNVGVGRSMIASFGLYALDYLGAWLASKTLLSGLIGEAVKNGNIDELLIIHSCLRTGMFFGQASAQIKILRESNPRDSLPKYSGKILFINGSKDHRDSETIWKSLCQHGELKVYEGGDHFFSHDKRFLPVFMDDLQQFCESIVTTPSK
jgi:pimeloyl-ACP methyl ester carboxylesterase